MKREFDAFNTTTTNIKHILRSVTLSECTECSVNKFNSTYSDQIGQNEVVNIFPPVLINTTADLDQEMQKYKFWVRNHAICNFVEELHYLFVEMLSLIDLHKKKVPSNSVLNEVIKESIEKSNKNHRHFSHALEAISKVLKLDEEKVESINSLIQIRNAITHDKSLANKTAERDRSNLVYYRLYIKERRKSDKPGLDEVVIGRKKEEKLFITGEDIQFTYQETNDIADTIITFIDRSFYPAFKAFFSQ